jgi:hypothetical protein
MCLAGTLLATMVAGVACAIGVGSVGWWGVGGYHWGSHPLRDVAAVGGALGSGAGSEDRTATGRRRRAWLEESARNRGVWSELVI